MSYLGIDIGSSQVKSVAFDETGHPIASSYSKYSYSMPRPGWMELDAAAVIAGALRTIAECAARVREISPVTAIGISSQGEAFVPVDTRGSFLAPAMISGDTRAEEVFAAFAEDFGRRKLYDITGHTPSPMFSLGKLLWLLREHPEMRRKICRVLCFEDLLIFTLTGHAVIGWPLAARTMYFDVVRHDWSDEIFARANLDRRWFSVPLPSGSIAGKILPARADELGLAPDTVLVTGGHDQIIGAVGCGAVEPGSAMFAAGSVECMVPVLDRMVMNEEMFQKNFCTYDFAFPGRWATLAYSLTGSNMLEYFLREFGRDCEGDYTALLDTMPDALTDLLALPYLTPSGTPWFDTKTPGAVYGWRFHTSRGELLKALWEGIAMEMRLNLNMLRASGVRVEHLTATGGGFRHLGVVRLHADVLGVPITLCNAGEAGCRGAASLAALATAGAMLPAPETVAAVCPDAEKAGQYDRKFRQWEKFASYMRNF